MYAIERKVYSGCTLVRVGVREPVYRPSDRVFQQEEQQNLLIAFLTFWLFFALLA